MSWTTCSGFNKQKCRIHMSQSISPYLIFKHTYTLQIEIPPKKKCKKQLWKEKYYSIKEPTTPSKEQNGSKLLPLQGLTFQFLFFSVLLLLRTIKNKKERLLQDAWIVLSFSEYLQMEKNIYAFDRPRIFDINTSNAVTIITPWKNAQVNELIHGKIQLLQNLKHNSLLERVKNQQSDSIFKIFKHLCNIKFHHWDFSWARVH